MRIIVVTILTLLMSFVCFLTVKYWGRSLSYTEYNHPMLQQSAEPIIFSKPSFEHLDQALAGKENLFLDISVTFDQKLVIPRRQWQSTERPIRLFNYDEVKNDVILLSDVTEQLKNKKLVLNIIENAHAVHQVFIHNLEQMGLAKGDNFIVTSPYEAPMKALKEIAPALVFATTQPEILKIVAMQSMHLIEAVSFRADVILQPLKIRQHDFFNEELLAEMKRRKKKILVGPIEPDQIQSALQLEPLGIIIYE
ncbi:hypothetical protein [Pseudobdellovibrio exovorus]|uniref:Uncharacterized protein n=1 Tax=Pseudobdellovibrio exovorus JSS TaxID=1184267 RepID=M4VDI7_9BACT|nr:hypothetical protein [Pseudobdellovibrio exovorus]AGH96535.1 hypothetical protein A11Q_2319 [Pseudobdellovibrio exovorus JSS]